MWPCELRDMVMYMYVAVTVVDMKLQGMTDGGATAVRAAGETGTTGTTAVTTKVIIGIIFSVVAFAGGVGAGESTRAKAVRQDD